MSLIEHRKKVLDAMEENSFLLLYAGIPTHTNEDEYYNFEENSSFFYLTGLEREGMALILANVGGIRREMLFIDEADPLMERWTGHMPTAAEVQKISGIQEIHYTTQINSFLNRFMTRFRTENAYFDTSRNSITDLPDYNSVQANKFAQAFPAVRIRDIHSLICPIRQVKDAEEVADIRKAIGITKLGLDAVLENLKPGMKEYQVQAVFEGTCKYNGTKRFAFNTIAGAGLNGCMMHYVENEAPVEEGEMILLDLGAKYNNYCSDISRTYPANGKYTPRQREYYELVLKANKAVAAAAKPGMTLKELDNIACEVLSEGLVRMGKIKDASEIRKYYMHSVSHSIGIDCHDINCNGAPIQAGWIISDEPGVYVDEEKIGIRIEDDLLITEDGCEVLSKDIIKEPDEIEAYMAEHRK